jgi:CheY-like chemotaxis protein
MLVYSFSIHNIDGSYRETTGRMALRDDNAARVRQGNDSRYDARRHPAICGLDDGCCQGRAPGLQYSLPTRNESRRRHLDSVGRRCVLSTSAIRRPVVLIVEDEFLQRMNAAEMIGDAGFNVVEAGNADEAIAILEGRPDIRVVFTDIQMPGSMDGLKLAQFVRGRWPPIKIVATSGFVNVGKGDLPEGSRFLPKPYRPEQIVAALRELTAAA